MKKVIFATLVALGAPALADNRETAASFMQCARIADDARRLGCYDRLATDLIELGLGNMSPAAPPAAGVAATSAPPTAPGVATSSAPPTAPGVATSSAPPPSAAVPAAPVVETPRAPEPEVVASAVPVTAPPPEAVTASAPAPATPAPAASPAPQSSAEEAFGSERTEAGQDKALKEIKSRYVGEFRGWTGKTVFELENGQVWQQTRSGRMMWRADSPMITIKRGFMGGYRLSVEGVNKEVYVKRIK